MMTKKMKNKKDYKKKKRKGKLGDGSNLTLKSFSVKIILPCQNQCLRIDIDLSKWIP